MVALIPGDRYPKSIAQMASVNKGAISLHCVVVVSLMQYWASVVVCSFFGKQTKQPQHHPPTVCFDSYCKGEKPYEMLYGNLEFVCFMAELSTGSSYLVLSVMVKPQSLQDWCKRKGCYVKACSTDGNIYFAVIICVTTFKFTCKLCSFWSFAGLWLSLNHFFFFCKRTCSHCMDDVVVPCELYLGVVWWVDPIDRAKLAQDGGLWSEVCPVILGS